MAKLAYVYHPLYEKHFAGHGHPESPERLQTIRKFLEKKGFFEHNPPIIPEPASIDQVALVHNRNYIQSIVSLEGVDHHVLDIGDTVLSEYSVAAALLAAGAAIKAVDLMYEEKYDKVFAAVRPPGHHAENDHARGFCIFNNIAIGARYAQQKGWAENILIIDWDVHHGNGTQNTFYEDPSVFYFSMHQYPFFPGSGAASERGRGAGDGYTLNIPLKPGHGDNDYLQLFENALQSIKQSFPADLVLISAGFDAHESDPIGGMRVTTAGFYKMTEIVSRFAGKHCQGRIISLLEGGYHYQALAESVYQHLNCMAKF